MLEKHLLQIVQELSLQPRQVAATAILLEEGATVPFIARYRKERTGELDEVQIANIRDRMQELEELDKRRESILSSLEERKLLTEELKVKIDAAKNISTLEDLYLPFRPKKRTRATMAKEKGLEPLADILWEQKSETDPEVEAAPFVSAEKEVPDTAAALAGDVREGGLALPRLRPRALELCERLLAPDQRGLHVGVGGALTGAQVGATVDP